MKRKAIFIVSAIMCLALLFTGCSNQGSSSLNTSEPFHYDNENNMDSVNEQGNDSGVTVDACAEGLYIKRDDLFYRVNSEVYYTCQNGANKYDHIMGIGMLKTDDIPIYNSDDKLAVFNNINDITYRAIPVTQKGYCAEGIIDRTGHTFDEKYQVFYKLSSNPKGFDVLDGQDIQNLQDLETFANENNLLLHQEPKSTGRYSFLFSENKKNIDAVYYSGTQAVNYTMNIDTPAVLIDTNRAVSLDFVRTDEGYFYLNLSNLEPARYVIALKYGAVQTDHCYLIEVK